MKTPYTTGTKGYVSPQNSERNSQAVMINDVSEPAVSYGNPAMSPKPKPIENFGGETGHTVEVQEAEYIANNHT